MNNDPLPLAPEYHSILALIPQAALVVDEMGRIVAANQNVLRETGHSSQEMAGKTLFELNPHFSLLSWKKYWRRLEKKSTFAEYTEFVNAIGVIYPVATRARLLSFRQQVYCIMTVENLLQKNRYKDLLDLTAKINQTGHWEWDLVTRQVLLNWSAFDLLGEEIPEGLKSEWVALRALRQRLPRQQTEALLKKGRQALAQGAPFETEILLSEANGPVRRLEIVGVPFVTEGTVCKLYGTIREISSVASPAEDLYMADFTLNPSQGLSHKQERDAMIDIAYKTLNQAHELIIWVNLDGSFLFFNEAARRRLGYDRPELNELHVGNLNPDLNEQWLQQTWKKLNKEQVVEWETELTGRNGQPFPVEVNLIAIRHLRQKHICMIFRDISARKNREQELQDAFNQIRDLKEKLEREKIYLREEVAEAYNFNNIISKSPNYQRVLRQVSQVAATEATVLILGETGTGKELLARAIHNLSDRDDQPLVKVNCAALPEHLIESELFGHEKGAFTGAFERKTGRFELADGGTVFLDEIGELPLELQSKLLRVIQEGQFERVGNPHTITVDVRILAATNRNLEKLVSEGKFREDLYYRLNVFPIYNIPLRERKEDIPLLVQHFTDIYGKKNGKPLQKIPQSALDKLLQYEFPGNIRELQNMVERAVILSPGNTLNLEAILPKKSSVRAGNKREQFLSFDEMQRQHILNALERTHWRVSGDKGAAKLLGLNGKTLASKMRKLGIRREDFVEI